MATTDQTTNTPARLAAQPLHVKVPEVMALFWALKLLTTGTGEATSDFLGSVSVPLAGAIGIFGFLIALRLQLGHAATARRATGGW